MNAPAQGAQAEAAPGAAVPTFAGVTYEDALARARALLPVLRERAAHAEEERVMLPETLADLHRTGVLRVLQPRRWGGMELDFVAYVDFSEAIARGCASTGWNVGNLLIHHWMLALYDERAQQEVWGADPEALIASGIAYPQGSARRVPGGLRLSGRWNFSSGVNVAGWNMLACIVRESDGHGGDKVVDHRMCLLPKSDYEIVDDWYVLGMRSTGSMTVVAKDVFVPEHRALCMYDARGGDGFPGAKGNSNPVYRVPLSALGAHGIGGAAVGNAQAALELSIEAVKARSTNYQGLKMRDIQTVQLRIGAAGARIEAARQLLRANCIEAMEIARRNVIADAPTKLRFKRDLAYAAALCTEAVDLLHAMAGANGIYDSYPIQRIFRDAHALGAHFSFSTDAQFSAWGLAALGGDVTNPTL
jgi:3-hydroxy-9,10-secoandrosta-1,3,5(10)-triene-9,17-dione monooxygenase